MIARSRDPRLLLPASTSCAVMLLSSVGGAQCATSAAARSGRNDVAVERACGCNRPPSRESVSCATVGGTALSELLYPRLSSVQLEGLPVCKCCLDVPQPLFFQPDAIGAELPEVHPQRHWQLAKLLQL